MKPFLKAHIQSHDSVYLSHKTRGKIQKTDLYLSRSELTLGINLSELTSGSHLCGLCKWRLNMEGSENKLRLAINWTHQTIYTSTTYPEYWKTRFLKIFFASIFSMMGACFWKCKIWKILTPYGVLTRNFVSKVINF